VKPEPDPDEEPLVAALADRGVEAWLLPWDAHDDSPDADLVVLRSTWNYAEQPEAFLRWLQDTAERTALLNPEPVARHNLDKRYLLELAARGLPTVDTLVFDRVPRTANAPRLSRALGARGWRDVVVKPVVGCASLHARHFVDGDSEEAQHFFEALLAERAMMVQPYQRAIEGSGERALVWIDGELTHAVRKTPRFAGDDEQVSDALPISRDEAAVAERALAPFASELLYARIDVVANEVGDPQIMELELVEPSLFLIQHPAALARLADAIARRVRARRRGLGRGGGRHGRRA
jgi:glutathione synthase/RimK-type ligase-like ATP-grasp enzyme